GGGGRPSRPPPRPPPCSPFFMGPCTWTREPNASLHCCAFAKSGARNTDAAMTRRAFFIVRSRRDPPDGVRHAKRIAPSIIDVPMLLIPTGGGRARPAFL